MKASKIILLLIAMVAVGAISFFVTSFIYNGKNTVKSPQTGPTSTSAHATMAGMNSNSLTKSDTTGAVGIYTTLIAEKSNSNQLTFEVVMNSQTVDLHQYDLPKLAALSFGTQKNNPGTFEWESTNIDAHNRIGYLKWSGIIDKNYKKINLELKDIGHISTRTFSWKKSKLIDQTLTNK
jgi:hypothetical protein